MKRVQRFILLSISLFIILPCLLVVMFQKDTRVFLSGEEDAERYLPGILYEVIDREMQFETLKAQAVLVRSNIIKAVSEGTVTYRQLKSLYSMMDKRLEAEDLDFYERLVRACEETEGEVVFYDSKICWCPYFYASCGTTRDAFSFFGDDSYPYLTAVPSHRDEECESYITYHHFSLEEFAGKMEELIGEDFENEIQILEKDSAGYIIWLKIGNTIVGGEKFRNILGLSSACFSIEQEHEGIRITCKGRGHGFGFSQYGANAMAADKKNYIELIEYYFHNISIENVYTFS